MAVFKARARALDMLGRQQIAGIPTAVSELFKNAHDAYADRVEVDYFREMGLFVLRDDGLGMTLEDFETRWLTLGTESKLNATTGIKPPPVDFDKPLRPVMGEKGIGRLAIAIIGPQVLILTRAKRPEGLYDLVAAFIHWGLFELPGIDLDQIEIPLRVFPGGTMPGRSDIASMLNDVRHNLDQLNDFVALNHRNRILNDLDQFDIDPKNYDGYLLGPALSGKGHGTHFYILPSNENLDADLNITEDTASSMAKTLLGFTNTMSPEHPLPVIKTAFRDHKNPETYDDIVETFEFFVPPEFINADHYITGEFDEFGHFKGKVSVFGTDYLDHVVPWRESQGKKNDCGPFKIEIGYIQGIESESTLPREDFDSISKKLEKYGGLYIYRDNLRVLPYGDTNFDWIDMETRRSKNARFYFFSYRRIFGLININQQNNSKLIEKAGREGFRENKAYRQFRSIIQQFFIQIAADFFRNSGNLSEVFIKRKNESKTARAAEKRERDIKIAHDKLDRKLEKAFQDIEKNIPQKNIDDIIKDVNKSIDEILSNKNYNRFTDDISQLETDSRRRIRGVRDQYNIIPPAGIGLSVELRRQSDLYRNEFDHLDREVFQHGLKTLQEIIKNISDMGQVVIIPEKRLRQAINVAIEEIRLDIDSDTRLARSSVKNLEDRANTLLKEVQADVNVAAQAALAKIDTIQVSDFSEDDLIELRLQIEESILQSGERGREILQTLTAQLDSVQWKRDNEVGVVSSVDETAALEEELLALRERAEQNLELVQLGTAIDIINHEFTHTITAIRNNLRRLQAWGEANPRLGAIYQDLRSSFDHLDGYLTLFTPLHRRLYRTQTQFTGASIAKYLTDLFGDRLKKLDITMEVTSSFRTTKIISYASTFYPVFVNLVDNATYWLQNMRSPRIILLDAQGADLLFSDTGPGIPLRDGEVIFQSGFTRKPDGRGLGLFISRDALRRVGWELILEPSKENNGAAFRIRPVANSQENS